jgi:hypothetical protein
MAELHQTLLGRSVFPSNGQWFDSKKVKHAKIVAVWLKPHRIDQTAHPHSDGACVKPQLWVAIAEKEFGEVLEGPITEFGLMDEGF